MINGNKVRNALIRAYKNAEFDKYISLYRNFNTLSVKDAEEEIRKIKNDKIMVGEIMKDTEAGNIFPVIPIIMQIESVTTYQTLMCYYKEEENDND